MTPANESTLHGLEIAVIGMAGRFPGAANLAEFWQNLCAGKESMGPLTDDYLSARGLNAALANDPDWRKIGAPLADSDCFDAGFFGYSAREAEMLDPQQRVFLECAWHALEDAGYDAERYSGAVGVFGGVGMNGYLLNLYGNPAYRDSASPYELFVANDKDFLATRVAYQLGLRGPAISIQTACSSSLVAVHVACQSLLSGECDMALAGGAAVSRQIGYRYQPGGIYSADGHCRAFDADAGGTVPGNGVGIVVLKRLADALADGDAIAAVIKGSAVNNDGRDKVGFTAPSVAAQSAVIRSALAAAGVSADSIGYVEAHGTATRLGDPIEIAALRQAFTAAGTDKPRAGVCLIGSVKTNIGHLDAAAGIAGLIKTVLALKHRQLPASLHFRQINPQIDFGGLFRVNTELTAWDAPLRRAGVSCFGIGGTNAHAVLEQAPPLKQADAADCPQLLALSAKSPEALQTLAQQLARHLQTDSAPLRDVAWTLQTGRRAFAWRLALPVGASREAIDRLLAVSADAARQAASQPNLVWLFSGQGSQQPAMAQALYRQYPIFKTALDRCAQRFERLSGRDLLPWLCDEHAADALNRTEHAQPALFAFEYALAELWRHWGLLPRAMLGHSLGEYVAACMAEVFDPETGMVIVATRARLMQAQPAGAMLAVLAPATGVSGWLPAGCAIAAVNGAEACVVSGSPEAVARAILHCEQTGLACKPLPAGHAFHSPMMADAAERLAEYLAGVELRPPQIDFISNLTGTWIRADQATDPHYWARQMLEPVQFAAGLDRLRELAEPVFLEIGPGQTLSGLARRHFAAADGERCIASLAADQNPLPHALGKLWQWGLAPAWQALHEGQPRRQSLPGYPFARTRYWVDAEPAKAPQQPAAGRDDAAPGLYTPVWQRVPAPCAEPPKAARLSWLLLLDRHGLGRALAGRIEAAGFDVFCVLAGSGFEQSDYREFKVDYTDNQALAALNRELALRELSPDRIVDLRFTDGDTEHCFDLLAALIGAFGDSAKPLQLGVVTADCYQIVGGDGAAHGLAAARGLCQVAEQEFPRLQCRQIDLPAAAPEHAGRLWRELCLPDAPPLSAWRGNRRWLINFLPLTLPTAGGRNAMPTRGAFVLIGDLGHGMGAIWAEQLASVTGRRLVLAQATSPASAPPADLAAACRTAGAEVMELRLNPEDPDAIRSALELAGPALAGVFCSLPTSSEQATAPISLLENRHWQYNRANRLRLLENLIAAVTEFAPPWCCVQSSMSAVLGGVGLAPYAAAYRVIDELIAQQAAKTDTAWFSINWDAISSETVSGFGAGLQRHALTPAEIRAVTAQVIAAAAPGPVAVSRQALPERLSAVRQTGAEAEPAAGGRYARPRLSAAYQAPRNPVETAIAEIWRELLRLDRVGIHDSFFELGGHSLLAIQAVGKMRQAFPVQLELRELLDGTPTVAGIAGLISAQLPGAEHLDTVAALLAEVEAMSDADIAAQLTPSTPT